MAYPDLEIMGGGGGGGLQKKVLMAPFGLEIREGWPSPGSTTEQPLCSVPKVAIVERFECSKQFFNLIQNRKMNISTALNLEH